MAYRSSTTTLFVGTAILTATLPAGVASGDRLAALVVASEDPATTDILGAPGWTSLGAETGYEAPGPGMREVFEKRVATGADSTAFSSTGGTLRDAAVSIVCLRDRHGAQAAVQSSVTFGIGPYSSPATIDVASVNSLERDDALWMATLMPGNAENQTWSVDAPSQYVARENETTENGQITLALHTRDGVPSGSSGVRSAVATLISGTGEVNYISDGVSVPAGVAFVNVSGLRW